MGRLRCSVGAGVAGAQPSRLGCPLGIHGLARLGFGQRPPLSPSSWAGRDGQGARAGGCAHLAPGQLDREEEPARTPGTRRGGA